MRDRLDYKQYNFVIFNFNSILREIETNTINDLHKYNLLSGKLTSDVKRLLQHHIIFGLCEFLLKACIREKIIVYLNTAQLENSELLKYFDVKILLPFINTTMRSIKHLLPIKIFTSSVSFDFLAHVLQKNDGRSIEIINKIRHYLDSINLERYTFSKIKAFTKRKDLTFLNKEYFNQLKSKQLIIV